MPTRAVKTRSCKIEKKLPRLTVFGINAVTEALAAGRAVRLFAGTRRDARMTLLLERARAQRVPVERIDTAALDAMTAGGAHQQIAAEVRPSVEVTLAQIVAAAAPGPPLVLVLDGIEDPQNLGTIVRTADAAGVHGVIRQSRHAAPLAGAAAKASAGAVHHVPLATVVNIARAVDALKDAGVWTVGLAGDADRPYDEIDYRLPTAIVLGAEGDGLRRLVRERCDWVVSIPMHGRVASLNVGAAAAVVLYEAVRQRRRASSTGQK